MVGAAASVCSPAAAATMDKLVAMVMRRSSSKSSACSAYRLTFISQTLRLGSSDGKCKLLLVGTLERTR